MWILDKASRFSDNTLDSYSEGAWFQSGLGHCLSWLKFCGFPSSQMQGEWRCGWTYPAGGKLSLFLWNIRLSSDYTALQPRRHTLYIHCCEIFKSSNVVISPTAVPSAWAFTQMRSQVFLVFSARSCDMGVRLRDWLTAGYWKFSMDNPA
jgi:hypothetical protein